MNETNTALLLLGHMRSLDFVWPSMRDRVLQPMREACDNVDVIICMTQDGAFSDPIDAAAGESIKIPDDISPVASLVFTNTFAGQQVQPLEERALANGNPWPHDGSGRMLTNHLRYLWSMAQVAPLLEERKYSAVFMARGDLFFNETLNFERYSGMQDFDAIVPAWHSFGGLNDRMAYLRPLAIAPYLGRIYRVVEFLRSGRPLHAERYLAWSLSALSISKAISETASRVRPGGAVRKEDFTAGHQ